MSEASLEELEKRLSTLTGPDGIAAFEADLAKLKTNLKEQISVCNAQIQALGIVERLLGAHKQAWGLTPAAEVKEVLQTSAVEPTAPVMSEECRERLSKRLCIFRSRDKKWCARKLTTKAEQSTGYCRVHMDEMGIEPPKPEKTTKKVSQKRATRK